MNDEFEKALSLLHSFAYSNHHKTYTTSNIKINFSELASIELRILGFREWDDGLFLIPSYFVKNVASQELETISGRKISFDSDNGMLDDEERAGMLAYGVRPKI